MSDPRVERDKRQQVIADHIWHRAKATIEGNLPNAALTRCAEEDVNAAIDSLIEDIDEAGLTVVSRERISAYLLTHVGGDASDAWQSGHNYAMREAARLVREAWDETEGDQR